MIPLAFGMMFQRTGVTCYKRPQKTRRRALSVKVGFLPQVFASKHGLLHKSYFLCGCGSIDNLGEVCGRLQVKEKKVKQGGRLLKKSMLPLR